MIALHHEIAGPSDVPVLLLGGSLGTTLAFAATHEEIRGTLRSMLVNTPAEGYAACCGAIERMDRRGALPRIAAPTLVNRLVLEHLRPDPGADEPS